MRAKPLLYVAMVLLGCMISLSMPSLVQAGGGGGGGRGGRGGAVVPIPPNYKGPTTTRSYQPMPTIVTPAGSNGDPPAVTTTHAPVHVEPITDEIRRDYADGRNRTPLNKFYTKMLTIRGVLVVGSDKVSDWAFLEAAYTLDHQFMNSPKWVTDGFATTKVHLAIIADVEYTMDLPENQNPGMTAQAVYNDRRSRGLGGFPWCSCAEENLLNLRGDPYGGNNPQQGGENITIHEFSHTTASMIGSIQSTGAGGRGRQQGAFWDGLRKAFADSNLPTGRLGMWNAQHGGKVYASTDEQEFWAEGAQAWFDNANPGNSGGISVRNDVKTKDPELAALLKEIYGDGEWRYVKTTAKKPDGTPMRPPEEFAHLVGLDAIRTQFPVFSYNNSPRIIAASTQSAAAVAGVPGALNRGRGNPTASAPATAPTTAPAR